MHFVMPSHGENWAIVIPPSSTFSPRTFSPTPLPDTKGFKAVSTQKLYSKLLAELQTTVCFEDVAYHENILESPDSSFNISYRDAVK